MKNKGLWIGVLLLVVLGFIVAGHDQDVGKNAIPAAGQPSDMTAATSAAPDGASSATASTFGASSSQTPTPAAPPKAVAAEGRPVAASNAKPESIVLDLSSPFARSYAPELDRFIDQPADFDHYYVVAKWDCDNDCQRAGVIDTRNGKAYIAPEDMIKSMHPGSWFVPYSLDSNIYQVVNDDSIETYSFDGVNFTLLKIQRF